MSRYIDADAYAAEMKTRQDALKELIDDAVAMDNWERYDGLSREFSVFVEAKLTLDEMPTVDAVPVTRCAQCKWWWKVNGLCTHPKHCHDNVCVHECGKDYFCADGERKDGIK